LRGKDILGRFLITFSGDGKVISDEIFVIAPCGFLAEIFESAVKLLVEGDDFVITLVKDCLSIENFIEEAGTIDFSNGLTVLSADFCFLIGVECSLPVKFLDLSEGYDCIGKFGFIEQLFDFGELFVLSEMFGFAKTFDLTGLFDFGKTLDFSCRFVFCEQFVFREVTLCGSFDFGESIVFGGALDFEGTTDFDGVYNFPGIFDFCGTLVFDVNNVVESGDFKVSDFV